MKLPETPSNDWIDDRIEAYLDGELPTEEETLFEEAILTQDLTSEVDWVDELFLARQVRAGLRGLPDLACPPAVTEAVMAQSRQLARVAWQERLRLWFRQQWTVIWQPALAMSMLLLIVVSSSLIGRTDTTDTFAQAEVDQALAEVQWTLAYLSEMGRETGKSVRHDVIESRVVEPMQSVFGASRDSNKDMQP